MIMIYSDRLLIGDNDTYHNIIKLRLEANVLNLDEKEFIKQKAFHIVLIQIVIILIRLLKQIR